MYSLGGENLHKNGGILWGNIRNSFLYAPVIPVGAQWLRKFIKVLRGKAIER